MSIEAALEKARIADLDLVEVSPNESPPVAIIVDWGKYNYRKTKQLQKNRQRQKNHDIKQLRFGLKIGEHDMDIKIRKIKEFLEDGHKVKISAFFRGRELAHKEIGYELLDRIFKKIEDIAVIEQDPQFAGRYLTMMVRRNNSAKTKDS